VLTQITIIASAITALGIIIGFIFKAIKWFLQQQKQKEEIKQIKEENTLICYALSACLDGLMQLGANHSVPDAKDRLDKYLNKLAHK
jgi:hypothetical protein